MHVSKTNLISIRTLINRFKQKLQVMTTRNQLLESTDLAVVNYEFMIKLNEIH